MQRKKMLTVNQIIQDQVRQELDIRLLSEVLGFPKELVMSDGPLSLLRHKMGIEPSITGKKNLIHLSIFKRSQSSPRV